jgi:hypothetical protein
MKINRRRNCELIKYLKSVMVNPSIGTRTRMSAATRLDGLFARNEADAERAEVRKERAALAKASLAAGVAPDPDPLPPAPPTRAEIEAEEDLRIGVLLASMNNLKVDADVTG